MCPSCSAEYKADQWHLLHAGMTGGKGVPDTIRTHPMVFATLTAPSFGPVHRGSKPGRPASPCRPRKVKRTCPHGRPLWCTRRHDPDADLIGQPLCPECYDYPGQVIWQWWAPELWRRFTIRLRRLIAQHLGVSEKRCRDLVRVQFAKVAEYQHRGVIHFHSLVRLDGPPTDDDEWPAAAGRHLRRAAVRADPAGRGGGRVHDAGGRSGPAGHVAAVRRPGRHPHRARDRTR